MTIASSIKSANAWFALQTRMRYEKFVGQLLGQKGFDTFVPVFANTTNQLGRVNQLESVLFPGYVFARFDPLHRLPILQTPGVYSVVGHGKTPVPIPEAEIAAIQDAVISRMSIEPCAFVSLGSRVRVIRGPLANYEGVLVESRSVCRVVLSVSAIQRSIRVEVDRSDVVVIDGVLSSRGEPYATRREA